MTVYVDNMRAPFGRMIMSHMIADTDTELHAMADRIGIARRWHQGDHYDVSQSRRAAAIAAGAVAIARRQLSAMALVRRRTGALPAPELAVDTLRAIRRTMAENRKEPDHA